MSQLHGGRIVAKALKHEGVSHIFTLCGGHVMPIYDGCLDDGIRVVDMRHEQTAAHAADGWARVTGEPGVAVVTAGPGLTDAVTGVASAWRANIPMLIIGGQGPRQPAGHGLAAGHEPRRPDAADHQVVAFGARGAAPRRVREHGVPHRDHRRAGPGVPRDAGRLPLRLVRRGPLIFPTGARTAAGAYPDPAYIEQAIALLRKAEKPVALVGSQLFWSKRRDAYAPFVEHFGLPVYVNGQARGSLPPEHPNFFTKTRKEALRGADVILIFGTPLDFRLGYGRASHLNPQAKLIQVDLDGGEIGRNRHVDVGILGDTGMVMAALTAAATGMARGGSPAVREWVQEPARRRRSSARSRCAPRWSPTRRRSTRSASARRSTASSTTTRSSSATAATSSRPRPRCCASPRSASGSIPARSARSASAPATPWRRSSRKPGSNVIIVYGDGAFGLNGLEFEAFVRQKINVVGVIGNDAAWMQIRRGQVELYGEERSVATKLDFTHYEKVVEALGGHGEYVEEPGKIRPALERALGCGKPALVNVRIGVSEFRKGAISI